MAAHTTAKERQEIIARYRRSGLTQREFCDREGITFSSLQSWLYKRSRGPSEGPRFIEVTPSKPAATTATIELRLGGVRIMLPTTISDERIANLIVTLEHRARKSK